MYRYSYHPFLINDNKDLAAFVDELFIDASNLIISPLTNGSNHKIFLKEKHSFVNFLFPKNKFYQFTWCVLLMVQILSYTDDITWPFNSEKRFLWMSLSLDILSMKFSQSIPVCIFTKLLIIDLVCSWILWVIEEVYRS